MAYNLTSECLRCHQLSCVLEITQCNFTIRATVKRTEQQSNKAVMGSKLWLYWSAKGTFSAQLSIKQIPTIMQ